MSAKTQTPILLAALLVFGAAPALAQRDIDERLATAPGGDVEIVNTAGTVTVRGWDRDEIQVGGTLGQGAERLAVEGGRERTVIRVVVPPRTRNVRGTDLEVRVPAGKRVTVRTVSAEVEVRGITGPVATRTTSGDVDVSGTPAAVSAASTSGNVQVDVATAGRVRASSTSGDVEVRGTVRGGVEVESVSGDVELSATTPEVRATTVSGDLRLGGVSERVAASTVSGDADIRDSRIQYGSFETVSGDLTFEGSLQRGAAFNIQSHSGEVELILPSDTAADFELTTFSGTLQSGFREAAPRASGDRRGREFRATLGGGGALVTVKTFSGDVKLVRR